ncbi:eCIS core domain-containing protein [Pseudanabaena minima]|uniref:eCIS core domain-containing protein n=1 Tax=Pseudanabaena minima TaxID=890415 RepID=UPI003DA85FBE
MRLRKEKPLQIFSTKKSTTLNLQTRPFAPVKSEESDPIEIQKASRGTQNHQSENLLQRLIDMQITESRSPIDVVQRKNRKLISRMQPQHEIASSQIQAKLNIGEPNDKYEKEADTTAAKVVQKINSSPQGRSVQKQESMESEDEELQMKPEISKIQRQEAMEDEDEELQTKSLVQRRENLKGGEASTDLESSIQQARGSGQSLDPNLQSKMGQAMGADFSGVKVHTDSQSDQLNQSIQAKAFTTGQDIFFRQGAYNPSSKSGQELIAHELTHTVQQGAASKVRSKVQRNIQNPNLIQRNPFMLMEGYHLLKNTSRDISNTYIKNKGTDAQKEVAECVKEIRSIMENPHVRSITSGYFSTILSKAKSYLTENDPLVETMKGFIDMLSELITRVQEMREVEHKKLEKKGLSRVKNQMVLSNMRMYESSSSRIGYRNANWDKGVAKILNQGWMKEKGNKKVQVTPGLNNVSLARMKATNKLASLRYDRKIKKTEEFNELSTKFDELKTKNLALYILLASIAPSKIATALAKSLAGSLAGDMQGDKIPWYNPMIKLDNNEQKETVKDNYKNKNLF